MINKLRPFFVDVINRWSKWLFLIRNQQILQVSFEKSFLNPKLMKPSILWRKYFNIPSISRTCLTLPGSELFLPILRREREALCVPHNVVNVSLVRLKWFWRVTLTFFEAKYANSFVQVCIFYEHDIHDLFVSFPHPFIVKCKAYTVKPLYSGHAMYWTPRYSEQIF